MNRRDFLYSEAVKRLPNPETVADNQIHFAYDDHSSEVMLPDGVTLIEYNFLFEKDLSETTGWRFTKVIITEYAKPKKLN